MPRFALEEAFRSGLRPDTREPRNVEVLQTCKNLRASPYGLRDFHVVNQPFTDSYITSTLSLAKTWPFPQIIRGKAASYMVGKTAGGVPQIYLLTENVGSDWTAAIKTVYDADDAFTPDGAKALGTGGGQVQMLDMYDSVMFLDGENITFKTPWHADFWTQDKATLQIAAGCVFKEGQIFFGGFDSTNFWAAAWQSILGGYDDNIPSEIASKIIDLTAGAGTNWVWWGARGGGDLLWLLYPTLMRDGSLEAVPDMGFDATDPLFLDLWRMGHTGMRPMPWQGSVTDIKPLNEVVMVYGETPGGCTCLAPHNLEIGSTYGIVVLEKLGESGVPIANRGAVGGGDQGHLFIDDSGEAWFIGPDLSVERLGYKERFSPMLANTILVSYDPVKREFYITDGTTAYVWNGRLSEAPQMPTSVSFTQGGLVGVTTDTASPTIVTVKTNIIDNGTRKLKKLKHVNVSTTDTDPTGWRVQVGWRLHKGDSFTLDTIRTIKENGESPLLNLPYAEIEITLTASDRTKVDLDFVEIEFENNLGKTTLAKVLP